MGTFTFFRQRNKKQMDWNNELKAFIFNHRTDDPLTLALQQNKYPHIDMKFVVQQVEGYRMAKDKIPSLALCSDFIYPPKLNREQCSSEITAIFKAKEYAQGKTIADITGGLGIDSIFMATVAENVTYIEQNKELHDIAKHNFQSLSKSNICCHCGDGTLFLAETDKHFDLIYIDPARRDDHGRKVSAFENCTPNILDNLDLLLSKSKLLLIKSSPMIDISMALSQLRNVISITVLAVRNECKEVLFLCSKETTNSSTIYHCVNIKTDSSVDKLSFLKETETGLSIPYSKTIEKYIYDPNVSLLKGGAFKTVAHKYNVSKLHRNTHLYTSSEIVKDFPGRVFQVIKELRPSTKNITDDLPDGKAHVITRNYPISSQELQKKLRLKEGGELFVIGLTKHDEKKALLLCSKVE